MTNPMPQHDDTVDQPEAGAGRIRSRIDPLSLAALTVVSLAIAIFVTLGIVTLFGTEADDAVDVNGSITMTFLPNMILLPAMYRSSGNALPNY